MRFTQIGTHAREVFQKNRAAPREWYENCAVQFNDGMISFYEKVSTKAAKAQKITGRIPKAAEVRQLVGPMFENITG